MSRNVIKIFAVLLALAGLVWVLQGTNILPGSYMTGDPQWTINPFDEIAIEEALRIVERGEAKEVVGVTVGIAAADDQIRSAFAMGVDRAIRVDDPRDLDPYLYEAQRTRRVLDRIGGYPLSNLLWRKLAFGLSAGRVQTPALRILVDRQHEIDRFVPTPYWLLEAQLAGKVPPPSLAA